MSRGALRNNRRLPAVAKLDGPSTDQAENDAVLAFLEELQPQVEMIAEEADRLYQATGRARECLLGGQSAEWGRDAHPRLPHVDV